MSYVYCDTCNYNLNDKPDESINMCPSCPLRYPENIRAAMNIQNFLRTKSYEYNKGWVDCLVKLLSGYIKLSRCGRQKRRINTQLSNYLSDLLKDKNYLDISKDIELLFSHIKDRSKSSECM